MRVIAFSCAHICTPETQIEIQDHNYDYKNIRKLIDWCLEEKPDMIVNLGDFVEPMYDTPEQMAEVLEREVPRYKEVRNLIELSGNHDRSLGNSNTVMIDGVKYEHGHQLVAPKSGSFQSRDEYVDSIRRATRGISYRLVHGHTHRPHSGNPTDVGSITFTGTYGEIIDGKKMWVRRIENE